MELSDEDINRICDELERRNAIRNDTVTDAAETYAGVESERIAADVAIAEANADAAVAIAEADAQAAEAVAEVLAEAVAEAEPEAVMTDDFAEESAIVDEAIAEAAAEEAGTDVIVTGDDSTVAVAEDADDTADAIVPQTGHWMHRRVFS